MTAAAVATRAATLSDLPFLEEMLYEAATWRRAERRPPRSEVFATPRIRRYVDGWGLRGDVGVVAEMPDGRPVGAAWIRLFPADEPGFGFLDASIPEVSIAVVADYRGRGVGGALLEVLAGRARAAGFSALSLSVEHGNPSARLYERHGFRLVCADANASVLRLDL